MTSAQLKVASVYGGGNGNGASSFAMPFSNISAGGKFTYVTEIFQVDMYGQGNEDETSINEQITLYRSNPADTFANSALLNSLLCSITPSQSTDTGTSTFTQFYFNDGNGNGLIVPENTLWVLMTDPSGNFQVNVYYKMRKLPNKDLFTYMINQGSSRNEV